VSLSLFARFQNLQHQHQKLSHGYFTPRAFEARNGGALYEYLGVRIFKKYVPTSGDLITRIRGKKRLKVEKLGRRAALQKHRKQTCVWEWRHLVSALLLQSWAIFGGLTIGAEQFWVSTLINVLVNFYPIMLQRYNRIRIDACLKNMQPDKVLCDPGLCVK
jgi:hypothetical protein